MGVCLGLEKELRLGRIKGAIGIWYSITYIAYAPFVSNTLDVYRCFCVTGSVCLPSHSFPPRRCLRFTSCTPSTSCSTSCTPSSSTSSSCLRPLPDQGPANHPPAPARHRAPTQPSSCHSPSGPAHLQLHLLPGIHLRPGIDLRFLPVM